jgi:DNA (cytosine-5)-methyltransferase 1
MRVLNLYSGLGGNRALWPASAEVTAVESDCNIANVYGKRFPNDIRFDGADALKFLEGEYSNYDFIWSSPPRQSHGQLQHNVGVKAQGKKPIMPDMSLYAQIVFLRTYFKGLWVVENTIPYYEPLIAPTQRIGRHLLWSNFTIPSLKLPSSPQIRGYNKISDFDGADLVLGTKIANKRQVLRNCVDPRIGAHVYDAMMEAFNAAL